MPSPEAYRPLAPLTTLGVGGQARWFLEAWSIDDLREGLAWAQSESIQTEILAGGSNVVIADDGYPGLVLRVCLRGRRQFPSEAGATVVAAAGEPWDDLVSACVDAGLAGVECLSGIPGTVGATPVQNVGAYGQDVSGVLERVVVLDRMNGQSHDLARDACQFGYRTSRFKAADAGRFVVCEVVYRLERRDPVVAYPELDAHLRAQGVSRPTAADVRSAVLAVRRSKSMVLAAEDPNRRSVGSFFLNPVVDAGAAELVASRASEAMPAYAAGAAGVKIPAAWLLEQAGCGRGFGDGRVGLSSKHALAIVNRGGATAAEVVAFAALLKRRVAERFGVYLMPEPVFLGFHDDADVAYLRAGE